VKAKTINAIISKKMKQWWDSIEDEKLRELTSRNTIVTGGCIASMLLKDQPADFDVYLRTRDCAQALAEYYVKKFAPKNKAGIAVPMFVQLDGDRIRIVVKSAGVASEEGTSKPYEYFEAVEDPNAAADYVGDVIDDAGEIQDTKDEIDSKLKTQKDTGKEFRPVFLSTNAITLSNKVQVVLRFHGEPEEIHKNYDFVHCTNYWSSWDKKLTLHPAALESLITKELRYVGSLYPICSIFRLRKFMGRGWTINAGQILKMCMQVSKLNLDDVKVLEDQLTGVDVAYFIQVVELLKAKDPEKVDSAYLVEIIDRMF
jgi:hypothetical protein